MAAVFIGRFQPFHKGHLEAIKWILKEENNVSVVIGSLQESGTPKNPFSFKERKEMIGKTLLSEGIKNFKIFGLPDFFGDISWAKALLRVINLKPEEITAYTENSWTERCLENMKIRVVAHPLFWDKLSATKIREEISKNGNWKDLVPESIFNYLKDNHGEEKIKSSQALPENKIIKFIKEKVASSGAKGGVVGVSGGIDSALTAYLTKTALGKKTVFLWLPFVKECSFEKNIRLLEKKLKTKIKIIYLDEIMKGFLRSLPRGDKLSYGNLKPRIRMAILYYFANLHNLLVIGTTNKSEMEIGYLTKYGDGGVDIEPIANLYKTEVWDMAKRLNLPKEIIEAAPAAGLWPGQTDEKEIGLSYHQLDLVLKLLSQEFGEKEIFFLTGISLQKIRDIVSRKNKGLHKTQMPPVCL